MIKIWERMVKMILTKDKVEKINKIKTFEKVQVEVKVNWEREDNFRMKTVCVRARERERERERGGKAERVKR